MEKKQSFREQKKEEKLQDSWMPPVTPLSWPDSEKDKSIPLSNKSNQESIPFNEFSPHIPTPDEFGIKPENATTKDEKTQEKRSGFFKRLFSKNKEKKESSPDIPPLNITEPSANLPQSKLETIPSPQDIMMENYNSFSQPPTFDNSYNSFQDENELSYRKNKPETFKKNKAESEESEKELLDEIDQIVGESENTEKNEEEQSEDYKIPDVQSLFEAPIELKTTQKYDSTSASKNFEQETKEQKNLDEIGSGHSAFKQEISTIEKEFSRYVTDIDDKMERLAMLEEELARLNRVRPLKTKKKIKSARRIYEKIGARHKRKKIKIKAKELHHKKKTSQKDKRKDTKKKRHPKRISKKNRKKSKSPS